MPTTFDILTPRGIVYIRHIGKITIADNMAALADYAKHPDAAPGQMHLVDFTDVTEIERDYARLMALQAKVADVVTPNNHETLLVMLATSSAAIETATMVKNAWEGSGSVIPNVVTNEAEALAILGQPESLIADMLASV